jgi:hypothetical protein
MRGLATACLSVLAPQPAKLRRFLLRRRRRSSEVFEIFAAQSAATDSRAIFADFVIFVSLAGFVLKLKPTPARRLNPGVTAGLALTSFAKNREGRVHAAFGTEREIVMLRSFVRLAPAVLAAAALASAAQARPPLPDLVITQFGLQSWGVCAPGQTVFTFSMTVKNQGLASWVGESNVFVRDLKKPGWFTSVALQPIPPRSSRVIEAPIVYYSQDPAFMSSGAPHPFQATVNDTHMPVESDYANNAGPGPAVWMGKRVIMVDPPKGCGERHHP